MIFSATAPRAQAPDDSKAVARSKLVEGSDLLKRGEYRDALVRFQEAYVLVPSPKIYYNFGLAYIGLSRNADASEAFEKFLAEAADAAPDLRANAERHLATLALQTGTMLIDCDTAGAEISIDGRARGTTPAPGTIRLDPGPHQLVVEKPDLPPYTRKMNIDAGQKVIVDVHLTKAPVTAPPPIVMMMPSPQTEKAAPPPPTPTHTVRWKIGIGVGVLAVATLGYGVAVRLGANSHFSDFNNLMTTQGNNKCDADPRVLDHGGKSAAGVTCSSLLDQGNSAASKATVGLIAGGVLAAGAVALLVTSWNDRVLPKETAATDGPRRLASARCAPDLLHPGLSCTLAF